MSASTHEASSLARWAILITCVLAAIVYWRGTTSPSSASGLTSCVVENSAMEITQGINWDPRGANPPASVPMVKYRRTTVRVYLQGDCGTQSSVSGELFVRNAAGGVLLGPIKPLNGAVRPPTGSIMQVDREKSGVSSSGNQGAASSSFEL